MFIPMFLAIVIISSLSPTNIAFAIPFFLASRTASRTGSSCATATATVFIPCAFTVFNTSSKVLIIVLHSLTFYFVSSSYILAFSSPFTILSAPCARANISSSPGTNSTGAIKLTISLIQPLIFAL